MREKLYKIAKNFRDAIEIARQDFGNKNFMFFSLFPNGTCGSTCYMLAKYLSESFDLDAQIYYVEGHCYKPKFSSHAWLEICETKDYPQSKWIVDITGDQFSENETFMNNNVSIYVGRGNAFYDLWEAKRSVYNSDNMYLEPEDTCCYKIIVDIIKNSQYHN